MCFSTGSDDAVLALVNAGASVEAADKDGLTGELKELFVFSSRFNIQALV